MIIFYWDTISLRAYLLSSSSPVTRPNRCHPDLIWLTSSSSWSHPWGWCWERPSCSILCFGSFSTPPPPPRLPEILSFIISSARDILSFYHFIAPWHFIFLHKQGHRNEQLNRYMKHLNTLGVLLLSAHLLLQLLRGLPLCQSIIVTSVTLSSLQEVNVFARVVSCWSAPPKIGDCWMRRKNLGRDICTKHANPLSNLFCWNQFTFKMPEETTFYSLVRLVWPNTEELISRPFTGLYKIRLLLQDCKTSRYLRF